jgi:3,4-dihydroxy 2-butanone 4-phosphate synthase/GTP cyclohydrolase II
VCIPLTQERVDQLGIPMMVQTNTTHFGTPFTVTVEARHGITTGISASDRARTVKVLIDPASTSEDLTMPGHLFPLRARDGGVLVRAGQTEAVVDLCKLAGLYPAGVLCEIMRPDGEMARMTDLKKFAARTGSRSSQSATIAYRLRHRTWCGASPNHPSLLTAHSNHRLPQRHRPDEHVALVMGNLHRRPVLVRMHSPCVTGDVFGSMRCDCGEQLDRAMAMIAAGRGVVVYMRQEGRGISHNKLMAYELRTAASIRSRPARRSLRGRQARLRWHAGLVDWA